MLILFPNLDGEPVAIETSSILWLRTTLLADEPKNTTMIRYEAKTYTVLYTPEKLVAVEAKLSPHIKLAKFTTPMDTPVTVSAARVNPVLPATPTIDHPKAKAALILGAKRLAVRETVTEAQKLLNSAIGVA